MYHYVYKLEDINTHEYYIGSRSCKCHPTLDKYFGSMVVWKPDKLKLKKTILKLDFEDRSDAMEYEKILILKSINDTLNRNYSIPSKKFYVMPYSLKEGHQVGIKNSQYGTKWITNGIEKKKIKNDDVLPDGWKYGRVLKEEKNNFDYNNGRGIKNSQYGTKWINNGKYSIKIKNDDVLPDGWKYGYYNSKLFGYRWITNGIVKKKLMKGEKLSDGWKFLRIK